MSQIECNKIKNAIYKKNYIHKIMSCIYIYNISIIIIDFDGKKADNDAGYLGGSRKTACNLYRYNGIHLQRLARRYITLLWR